jgi:hypothetical protein
MPNPFEALLNAAGRNYQRANKALGGWLPGGGTASPLTRAKQEREQRMAEQMRRLSEQYAGQPGRLAGQGQLFDAIMATTQAGTNIEAVINNPGNPASVKRRTPVYYEGPSRAQIEASLLKEFLYRRK